MATIIPELSETQLSNLPSQAEAKLYRALRDSVPLEYVILFQVAWILQREDEKAKDGEADFLICHPDKGYLCIEVKGGGIGFDSTTGEWHSIDRQNQKHIIKNPITQSLRAKYSIKSKLSEHQRWNMLGLSHVLHGHAVFFPDIANVRVLSRPDMPEILIGGIRDLQNLHQWVDSAFDYWQNNNSVNVSLGRNGINLICEIFAKSFTVLPVISSQLAEQEAHRLTLTNDQIRILDFLRSRRRVAVSGGAGTGKTILAVEKARRLSSEGFRTLLTCYNRQLADYLGDACHNTPNLEVMSFHQLCYKFIEQVKNVSGRDLVNEAQITYPGKNLYDVHLPNALSYAIDVLDERYEAIVCDEGQDFREEYWMPLELLLSDYKTSPFYIFFDDNQNLYSRVGTFPSNSRYLRPI